MGKNPRQAADGFKAKASPQFDRARIAAYYEVELHPAKATFPRAFERMQAHRPRNSASLRRSRGDIPAIRDVRSATLLVRFQEISPQQVAVFLPNKDFLLGRKPEGKRLFSVHVPRQRVGFPGADHRLQNNPDCIAIAAGCRTNAQAKLPYFRPTSFSKSASLRMVTPSSLALSYFEPGSAPTTT